MNVCFMNDTTYICSLVLRKILFHNDIAYIFITLSDARPFQYIDVERGSPQLVFNHLQKVFIIFIDFITASMKIF